MRKKGQRQGTRNENSNERESDYGVPIPGEILPAEQWAKTAWKKLPAPGFIDWTQIFGREAPVVLDLGCGNGRFLLASALARPHCNHLGLDILPLVIRYATRRANQRGLHFARLAVCGAHEFLEQYVAPRQVAEIHLYHPQPYREEHAGVRRLITPQFLRLVHRALVPGGLFVVQTDNTAYWTYMRQVLPHWFDFHEQRAPWPDAPRGRTRREIYALQHRMTVYRGQGHALPLSDAQSDAIAAELPPPRFDASKK